MKEPKIPSFVAILILSLITIVVWASLGVYRNLTTEQPVEVPDKIIEPLTPSLDDESLDEVNQRLFFEESEIANVTITAAPEATEESALAEETVEITESTQSAETQ